MSAIRANFSLNPSVKAKFKSASGIQANSVTATNNISLGQLTDVDLTNLGDGSMLIYNNTTHKFVSNVEINNSNTSIIGGSF
jgi:hypothetical protein